ncbi:treslin-like [Littorina saxatilis]|uniref:treslin-like n=1 Tax=Littorina saxatilis TaxID=31220 RepID=UPI0038B4D652
MSLETFAASPDVAPDKKSYEIVAASLRSLGGALVPFQSLVTHLAAPDQQRHFAQVASASGDAGSDFWGKSNTGTDSNSCSGEKDGSDEVAVALSSFTSMSACSALVTCGLQGKSSGPVQRDNTSSVRVLMLTIGGKDEGEPMEIGIQLAPVTNTGSGRPPVSQVANQVDLQLCGDDEDCCCVLRSSRKTPQSKVASHLEMRGRLGKSHIRQLGANLGHHFVCFVAENCPTEQHTAFSSLLQAIHSQQQGLVLSCRVGNQPSPHLAVLEAASPRSAHLSYLSLAMTLQVEKGISLLGPKVPEKSQDSSIGKSSLQAFKDMAAKAIASHGKQAVRADGNEPEAGQALWTGVLNPWHVSGSVSHLQSALDKLTNRLEDMNYLSNGEKSVLVDIQQAYRQENQTPLLLQSSQQSTPQVSASLLPLTRTGSSDRSRDDASGSEGRSGLGRRNSNLPRGLLMVSKAMRCNSLPYDEVDGDYVPPVAADALPRLDVSHIDVKTVEDLSQYLQEQYEHVLETGSGMETAVQSMVTVTQHFMTAQQNAECPQKSAAEFLREKTLKSCKDLKAYYQNLPSEEDGQNKIIEFKLQILLRLEMESVCSGVDPSQQEQTADEIVELLRSLLFAADAGEVPHFLDNTVLSSYLTTLPQVLVTIYDELMQPLPAALAGFGSPGTTPSVGPLSAASLRSVGPDSALSAPPDSNQSTNSQKVKTRTSLRSHPSLTGRGKKRQIQVQTKVVAKPKADLKNKAKKERKTPKKQHKVKVDPEAKKARRNLFNTQTGAKSPAKGDKGKRSTPKKKQQHTTPKKSQGSNTIVAETPSHRQRSRLVWQQEQASKQLNMTGPPDVQVIEESPVKQIADLKSSPGRYKPARRVLRQSFYSAARDKHSRSLARALDLSSRIAGRHHRHQHLRASFGGRLSDALSSKDSHVAADDDDDILSPKRQAAAFLRAQLMKSPSPDLHSASRNTRSRTPQRLPRQQLFNDSLSLPAWSSAVSRLDFTSPVKRLSTSSSLLVAETPPRGGKQQSVLVADTPGKEEERVGQVTPVKTRSGQTTTPQKKTTRMSGRFTPKKERTGAVSQGTPPKAGAAKAVGRSTPKKGEILESPSQGTPPKGPKARGGSTPKKGETAVPPTKKGGKSPTLGERGRSVSKRLKGLSPLHSSSSSSSGSQQSSILDYISPTRKPSANQNSQKITGPAALSALTSPLRSSQRASSKGFGSSRSFSFGAADEKSPMKSVPSCSFVPSLSQPEPLLPNVGTPTKIRQEFMSPTKTPSKSILKNSPFFQGSQIGHNRTPQKSPRVTFDFDSRRSRDSRTPSPTGDGRLPTPDSMDKWRRRKRRWTGDSTKSASVSFDSSAKSSHGSLGSSSLLGKSVPEGTTTAVSNKTRVSLLCLEQTGTDDDSADRSSGVPASKKRSAAFSETGRSSPRKKRRTDSSVLSGVSEPISFSENAMDSYFSASNDDVFLASCSVSTAQFSSPTKLGTVKSGSSPQFKLKPQGLVRCKSSFTCEGSQGFEITGSNSKDSGPPSSPVFNTSPVPKHRTKDKTPSMFSNISSRDSGQLGFSDSKGKGIAKGKTMFQTKKQTGLGKALEKAAVLSTAACCYTVFESQMLGTHKEAHKSGTPGELKKDSTSRALLSPTRSASRSAQISPSAPRLTPLRVKGTPTDRKYSPSVSTTSLVQLMNSPLLMENPKRSRARLFKDNDNSDHDGSPEKPPKKRIRTMQQVQDTS